MGGELQHRQLIENPMEEKGRKLEEEGMLSSLEPEEEDDDISKCLISNSKVPHFLKQIFHLQWIEIKLLWVEL